MASGKVNNEIALLWTNPDPSSFAAGDISLDLSGYRFVFIQTTDGSCVVTVGYDRYTLAVGNYPAKLRTRGFKALINKISVAEAYNGSSVDNTCCAPAYIYGIR